ncbi:MAG TPA: winged helix-turn-helix domain-containing protein, partial [Caulobacteraceae bacterium]|nr:winged helix-turn-helix domain-containing protein [Caulobacteraceae bacterium]
MRNVPSADVGSTVHRSGAARRRTRPVASRDRAAAGPSALAFGPFRLLPAQRRLERDGEPLRIGGKALDLLVVLAARAGEVVSSRELLALVWQDVHVEESSLRFHIKNLRRVLGDSDARSDFVANVPGRGYCFVAPVGRVGAARDAPPSFAAPAQLAELPLRVAPIVGRAASLEALVQEVQGHRLVTLTGPGGIGKTTLGIAAASELRASFNGAIAFVDLSPVEDGELVLRSVASALGGAADRQEGVLRLLGDRRTLLVLDNCEQVVGAVATLAEAVLAHAGATHLLVTSREPLRVAAERVHRLAPLGLPPASPALSARDAANYAAVQLFLDRAGALAGGFTLDDANAATIALICRRLDGIPFAIELAAASLESLGISGLAEGLTDMFALLTRGRRVALPRQQALRATLDWSYNLLSSTEQLLLQRFSVFRSAFSFQSALALAVDERLSIEAAIEAIANTVAKSLVNTSNAGGATQYRLLETTKAYARQKAAESGEVAVAARRHAEHHVALLQGADHIWDQPELASRFAAAIVDDVRAAIDWSFSPDGDRAIGLDLLCVSGRLWFELSLSFEFRQRIETALAQLGAAADLDAAREARLQISLGQALWYAGSYGEATRHAFSRGLELAELGGVARELRLQALWGQWAGERALGRYAAALPIAERYEALARSDASLAYRLLGDTILGLTHHFLGDQRQALVLFERVRGETRRARNPPNTEFHIRPELASQTTIARILWLQGLPDQALAALQAAIDRALELDHWHSYHYVVSVAGFPLALWTGDLARAQTFASAMEAHGAPDRWMRCWMRLLRMRADPEPGPLIASYFEPRLDLHTFRKISEQLSGDAVAPRPDEDIGDGRWCLPEVLRVNAELHLWRREPGAAEAAEPPLARALELARDRGNLSWELRAATSLARLWRAAGREIDARDLLAGVFDRFTEGFATTDLQKARALLDDW